MSNAVYTHYDFLKTLQTIKPKYRKIILRSCDEKEINFICECIYNVLRGKVPINDKDKTKLKKYKHFLRKLVSKGNKKIRKKIIVQKGGAFLPIILSTVLGSILNSVLSK